MLSFYKVKKAGGDGGGANLEPRCEAKQEKEEKKTVVILTNG